MSISLGPIPPRVRDAVTRLIAALPQPLEQLDERMHGLPLMPGRSCGAWLFANGDVWHRQAAFPIGTDPIMYVADGPKKVGFVAFGARYVPDLREWLPRRPPDAVDCDNCGATGHWDGEMPCFFCSGMGWKTNAPPARDERA